MTEYKFTDFETRTFYLFYGKRDRAEVFRVDEGVDPYDRRGRNRRIYVIFIF